MAESLSQELAAAIGVRNRGAKPKSSEDRGGYLLKSVKNPCVIAEPFFIDNDNDLAKVGDMDVLVSGYLRGISQLASILQSAQRPMINRPLLAAEPSNNTYIVLPMDASLRFSSRASESFIDSPIHFFSGIPMGAYLNFTVADENSSVTSVANLAGRGVTPVYWDSDNFKYPAVALGELAHSSAYALTLDMAFMAQDTATVTVWIEFPSGQVFDSWSFQQSSAASMAHSVSVSCWMA